MNLKMSSSSFKANRIRTRPAYITFRNRKFLILESPSNDTIASFVEELRMRNVKHLVRVCEATYDRQLVELEGIKVLDWTFRDGFPPPPKIISDWLKHVKNTFRQDPDCCIAVHCAAGLGRAPVLVALALMDLGMNSEDAVEFIRRYRPGAMNHRQLAFLRQYESESCFHRTGCVLM